VCKGGEGSEQMSHQTNNNSLSGAVQQRPLTQPSIPGPATAVIADPQVSDQPVRRRFTAEYKRRIVREAELCVAPGQIGSLLRREGLYSSQLSEWRKQEEQAALCALAPKKRGRKAVTDDPLVDENRRLRQEKVRLERRLAQAELVIDIQKKVSELLGIPLSPTESDATD
jgi:transposase